MRTGTDLSLRQLALAAGSSASYICQVERGERTPSPAWLWIMAETLAAVLRAGSPAPAARKVSR